MFKSNGWVLILSMALLIPAQADTPTPLNPECQTPASSQPLEHRISEQKVVFLGSVLADRSFFIDKRSKGVAGFFYRLSGPALTSCVLEFEPGEVWVYAGHLSTSPSFRVRSATSKDELTSEQVGVLERLLGGFGMRSEDSGAGTMSATEPRPKKKPIKRPGFRPIHPL